MERDVINADLIGLIADCDHQHIKLSLTPDQQLKISAPDGKISKDLIARIKVLKTDLIAFLKEAGQKSSFEEITPVGLQAWYDVSPAQRRLWILSQFKENKANFHIPAAFTFQGVFKREVMRKTFMALIERHEILRTTFVSVGGEPRQVITPFQQFDFDIHTVDVREHKTPEQEAQRLARNEAATPFDLGKGPLFRVVILHVTDDRFVLLFTMHHIISDGWSMKIIFRDLQHFYAAFDGGQAATLQPLKIQYKDYTQWLNQQLSGEKLERQREFWHGQFRERPVVLELPTDFKRPPVLTNNGNTIKTLISPTIAEGLKALSNQQGTSLFMTLLAAVNTLLYRYAGKDDICIGSPIAGRVHADLEEQVGFYLNNIVFRTTFTGTDRFDTLLQKAKGVCLDAFEHQLYPFDKLIDELNLAQDRSRSPLFDVVLVLQNTDLNLGQQSSADVDVKGFDTGYRVSTSDLRLEFTELRHGLELSIDYNTDLFRESRIRQLLAHFTTLFSALIADPTQPLNQVSFLGDEETQWLHRVSADTAVPMEAGATLVSLFERQAAQHANRRAATYRNNVLTYAQLNQKANQLAHHLIGFYGMEPGDLVGIMLDRSENLLVAILAILKAGGAYLPIDPNEPESRKSVILHDASPKILITESTYIFNIGDYACELFAMDSQLSTLTTSTENPGLAISPRDLAYVIYTSGSTGTPKGVMVEHEGVVNVALDHSIRFNITPDDVSSLFFPVSFDASVFMIFMTLLSGAEVVVFDEAVIFDPHEYLDYMRSKGVTIASFTPSYVNLFNPETLGFLRVLITGGEAPNPKQTLACSEYTRMYNAYGPSECSVCATIKAVGVDDRSRQIIPIGSPINNAHVYLTDDAGNLVSAGIPGELWISGTGVARGYLNNPESTEERFVSSPVEPGRRAYRTGDLGKWTTDGQIEFLGRKDKQVKIRGFRIELGEIESVIASMPEVADTLVKVVEDQNGDKQLAAYYTTRDIIDAGDIKTVCTRLLPAYMIPNFFIQVTEFVRTANGKVNTDALPPVGAQLGDVDSTYVAPATDLERTLARVWEEQLNVEKIGVTKNFFSAGGDSIKAIRVAGAINKLLGTNIEVKEIFEYQEVALLARHIESVGELADKEADYAAAASAVEDLKRTLAADAAYSKLLPASWEDLYPMSEIQKGMIFYTLMNPTSGVYHDQMYYQFQDDAFDLDMFRKAIDLLVERQAIFRTSFHLHDFSEPIQIVHRYEAFTPDFEFVSLVHLDDPQKRAYLEDFLQEDRKRSFDFTRAGIWRIRVFHLAEQEYGFLLIGHHAMIDGWSDASFRTTLSNVYFRLKEDRNYAPAFFKVSYKDYIIDQCYHQKSVHTRDFWKTYLDGYSRTELPLHRANTVSHSARQQVSFLFSLSPDLTTSIFSFSEANDVSVKDLCLAALTYLLKITTNAEEVTLGLLTNGRPAREDADKIFGCFLNTVPFRQNVDANMTNRQFLKAICENSKQTKSYDRLPLTSIIEVIGEKSGAANPIFDVLFNFVNMHIIQEVHDAAKLSKPIVKGFGETNTLLDLVINSSDGYIQAFFCSYADIYEKTELERFAQYYQRILRELVADSERAISHEAILGQREAGLVKTTFNETRTVYPRETIHQLFEMQAARTPEAIALVDGAARITYAALNARANRLAHYLRQQYAIVPDDRIGIMMGRSAQMIVSILGVLKAGAAYVPIDPTYPQKRSAMILQQAEVKVLLTESELLFDVNNYYQGELFAIDIQGDDLETSTENPEVISRNTDLAYIMFTSGSTGLPKGVAVEHRSVVRLVKHTNYTALTSGDQVLQLSNYAFDGSVFDIYGALLNGATLHLVQKDTVLSHQALSDYILTKKINHTFITTALFNNLVEFAPACIGSFDKLYFGGEEASLTHIRKAIRLRKHADSIVHVYGPTENTTFSTYHVIDSVDEAARVVPIGKPISNSAVYILDEAQRPVPIGTLGEIYVSGEGLARGYWKNDALTREKFIKHPFEQDARLYRTGDLGRWNADGAVCFGGRKDAQVKIRGNRVELPEIENEILKHEGMRQVHVTLVADGEDDKLLVAYYVGKAGDVQRLRAKIGQVLPEYMVPDHFVALEALPFNKNGKINKAALPHPLHLDKATRQVALPQTDVERKLVAIWEKVLKRTGLGVDANFFELGGHSLKATQLVYYIAQELQVDIGLRDIFATPTVKEIAASIEKANRSVHQQIDRIEEQEYYEVSHAQKRLWIHEQHGGPADVYIVPSIYRFKGTLNQKALNDAFKTLIARHESLRTVFPTIGGIPRQRIKADVADNFAIEVIDCQHLTSESEVQAYVQQQRASIAFDLGSGPLLTTRLLKLAGDEYVFIFFMHHTISDGWSMGILMNEVTALYEHYNEGKALTLPALDIHYKDFAAWQNGQLSADNIQQHQRYWHERFSGELPVLEIPTDFDRPEQKVHRGAVLEFFINEEAGQNIHALVSRYQISLFVFLEAVLKTVLYKYSGQKDLIIGTPVAGRQHAALENQIGFYLNTLALRSRIDSTQSFREWLLAVKEETFRAFEHQLYPFDNLVNDLGIDTTTTRSPLFDVMLVVQNMDLNVTGSGFDHVTVTGFDDGSNVMASKYDMSFFFRQYGDRIGGSISYNTALFVEHTIVQCKEDFLYVISQVLQNPDIRIADLALASSLAEDHRLSAFID